MACLVVVVVLAIFRQNRASRCICGGCVGWLG
jgi:hypothetical protein